MTQPRTIGIVSSVDVSCGNAHFTRVLGESLSALPGVEVELLGLDLELTQSLAGHERRLADQHIADICRRMRRLDAVNIQFEPGLYGRGFPDVARRFRRLLDANPNTFVTHHAVRTVDRMNIPERMLNAVGSLLSFKPGLAMRQAREAQKLRLDVASARAYVKMVATRGRSMVVHTGRSARRIHRSWPDADVHVHPLRIVEPGSRSGEGFVDALKHRLLLPPDTVTVGVFGYFGGYKGMDTALRALKRLPRNHHLLVFGRQHPQTIRQQEPVGGAVATLVTLVDHLRLSSRVHFLGELDDQDFSDAAAGVDAVWLPYLEVDQDGSGIAAIAFDVAKRILASNSSAFDELLQLIPYDGVERFDIGNDLELAQKTLSPSGRVSRPMTKYTCQTQAELYYTLSLPRDARPARRGVTPT
jgi:glycosyltransferase involved in cell wall biosynthesis